MTPQARQEVAREAESWLGTPFHHHSELKGVGVDCAHLLIGVYSAVGLLPPVDPGNYSTQWHLNRSEEQFIGWVAQFADEVAEPQIGDVGLWQFGRCFAHGSILVAPGVVIHSYNRARRGVIKSRVDEDPLQGRAVKWWSLR